MPPKAKFTKEEILSAALDLVRDKGYDALTARALGSRLGSSPRPIFTVFSDMKEVEDGIIRLAKNLYGEYVKRGLSQTPKFRGVGIEYIMFSINEPKLFKLLFMKEHSSVPPLTEVLQLIEESYMDILSSITETYGLEKEKAEKLYRHLWIYSHGIASLCATNMCRFSPEEISDMLTEVFIGIYRQYRL